MTFSGSIEFTLYKSPIKANSMPTQNLSKLFILKTTPSFYLTSYKIVFPQQGSFCLVI